MHIQFHVGSCSSIWFVSQTTNFSKEEKLLMAALRENFQKEKKIKEYDHKTLQKFNSQNPNGVKREMNQIKRC